MTKLIEAQFPVLDHIRRVANIKMVTDKDKEFKIKVSNGIEQTLCIFNRGEVTTLHYDNKYLEIASGMSSIKLEDITDEEKEVEFRLEDDSCEYFVIGRLNKCQK